jgi:hypothetical protein
MFWTLFYIYLQRQAWDFVASVVQAVHANSLILTTIGLSIKWLTDVYPANKTNQFSDARLKAQINNSNIYLDAYSPHFYNWVIDYLGNPFLSTKVAEYGLTDKPRRLVQAKSVSLEPCLLQWFLSLGNLLDSLQYSYSHFGRCLHWKLNSKLLSFAYNRTKWELPHEVGKLLAQFSEMTHDFCWWFNFPANKCLCNILYWELLSAIIDISAEIYYNVFVRLLKCYVFQLRSTPGIMVAWKPCFVVMYQAMYSSTIGSASAILNMGSCLYGCSLDDSTISFILVDFRELPVRECIQSQAILILSD